MVSVYTDADFLSAYKQKQRIFGVFMAVTVAYLTLCVSMLIYHVSLPYADARDTLPKWLTYIASILYIVTMFPYMAIKYSRIHRYFKIMTFINEGLKGEERNYFYTFREKSLQKDNVDVVGCVFETWNKKKSEWMEREAYFDPEKPMPPFDSGDLVRYIVQSNFIIQYDILEKHAYEFYECDEDGEIIEENEENTEQGEQQ